jgi:ABC-type transport system involved in multi-copper enzyme maturation permease subunit
MRRELRSESIRIWRPSFLYGGIGLMAGFAALVSVFVYHAAKTVPATPSAGPAGRGFVTVAEIAKPGGYLSALGTVATLAGTVLLVLWAIAVASDYSTGVIRILVQAQPRRSKLLVGKIGALTGFTLVATVTTTLVVVLIARPLASLEGIPVEAWRTDFFTHLVSGYVNFTVAGFVWGAIGLMLAVLTRSAALAIGIGIGYLLVVESLISIVASGASPYLPGGALYALVSGGTAQLAWAAALGLSILYGSAAIATAVVAFHNRDITS